MTAPPKNSTVTSAEPQSFFSSSVVSQEMGLKVGQEASFAVQLNGARGLIDAKIHTPSGAIEECCITELDSGGFVSACQSLQWNRRTCFLLGEP